MKRLTIKRETKCLYESLYYAECKEEKCGIISCPFDCPCEIEGALFDRLGQIEDILGDEYDLDRLKVIMNQRVSLKEEVAERWKLTGNIPLDRLTEIAKAEKEGRCVALPCKNWLNLVFGEQEVFYTIDDDYEEEKIREITVRNEERFTWYDG